MKQTGQYTEKRIESERGTPAQDAVREHRDDAEGALENAERGLPVTNGWWVETTEVD